ncbi:HEAT repeat domain-containing protein [Mucilaginibacter sp. UYCu711]|uniref:HEAT repeat domain-containing protein n=1 Tax=Mucilaginibacter sp. UYCu711 TaxID=3156339 RepID=UPI003D23A5D0
MIYTMHDVIKAMLKGGNIVEPVGFEMDEDLSAYARYIPGLCELLRKDRSSFELYQPGIVLMQIMPREPEPLVINLLLKQLSHNRENGVIILKILAQIFLPETTDLSPILEVMQDDYFKYTAVMALQGSNAQEAEKAVLALLRETISPQREIAQIFCETLGQIGTVLSLPVLMAVCADYTDATQRSCWMEAIAHVGERLGMPADIRVQFGDPTFWKLKWRGKPEHFAGFIEFISIFMINGGQEESSVTDQVGEIFMREMEVDISPYQSFLALRLSSPPDGMLEGLIHMKENLECQVLLDAVTEHACILPSVETMAQDIYFELMNDYLMTRLRRHFRFAANE